MAPDGSTKWLGYAPPAIRSHKYAVRYHPKLGRRVACTLNEPSSGAEITLFCPDAHSEIESLIPDGGPFFVNEWKQVLKPVMGDEGFRDVLYLGHFPDLHFRFQFRGRVYDNKSSHGLEPGDPWKEQEVGMMYKYDLSEAVVSREIVSWEDYAAVHETETLERPPERLLTAFGRARPGRRSGRFYVNEHGVVFLPAAEHVDVPVYVGRIDVEADRWFEKHEPDGG